MISRNKEHAQVEKKTGQAKTVKKDVKAENKK